MQEYDYKEITAEKFRAKTIVPTVEDPRIHIYELDAGDVSAFMADMNDPVHGEEIVDIEPLNND